MPFILTFSIGFGTTGVFVVFALWPKGHVEQLIGVYDNRDDAENWVPHHENREQFKQQIRVGPPRSPCDHPKPDGEALQLTALLQHWARTDPNRENATILRPAYFMNNDHSVKDLVLGRSIYPMPIGAKGVTIIDARDLGEIAVIEPPPTFQCDVGGIFREPLRSVPREHAAAAASGLTIGLRRCALAQQS